MYELKYFSYNGEYVYANSKTDNREEDKAMHWEVTVALTTLSIVHY